MSRKLKKKEKTGKLFDIVLKKSSSSGSFLNNLFLDKEEKKIWLDWHDLFFSLELIEF